MPGLEETAPLTPTDVIVGRTAELAQLEQSLARALAGERQLVFVTGEAGIGKTALVETFLASLRARPDLRIGYGQCIEHYGPGEAYLPLLEAANRLCREPGGAQLIEALRHYAPTWLVQLSSLIDQAEREALQRQLQGTTKERMLREAVEVMSLLTTRRSLLLVLEDLHWSDVSTVEWLSYLAQWADPMRLLVLGTYRSTDALASSHPLRGVVQELQAKGQCRHLALAPLSDAAVTEYLRTHFPQTQLPAEVSQAIQRRAGGNPLFLMNVVRDLAAQGLLGPAADSEQRQHVLEALEGAVPHNLRLLIERQVERLDAPSQQLLATASVVGTEFAVAAVAAGLGEDLDPIEARCEALSRHGHMIEPAGLAEWADGTLSGQYRFRHALYQQVLYEQLAQARQTRLHRAIAERLETGYGSHAGEHAGELARHFEQGRAATKAIQYHLHAGETALQHSAHQEAIYHLTRGLNLVHTLPDTPERVQQELALQISCGVALIATTGFASPEVEQAYTRARSLCEHVPDIETVFPVLYGLWNFHLVRLELDKAEDLANQLFALAEQQDEAAYSLIAYNAQGQTAFQQGRITTAREYLEHCLSQYDPQHHHALTFVYGEDPGISSHVLIPWALWYLGYPDQARQQVEVMIRRAGDELNHPFSLAQTLAFGGSVYLFRREADQVQQHAQRLILLCHEHAFSMWPAEGTIQLGWTLAEHGQAEEGSKHLSQGLADWQATGARIFSVYHLALQAEVLRKAGHIEQGLSCLAEALELIATTQERSFEAEVYRLKGELLLNDECRTQNDERQKKSSEMSSVHHSSFSVPRSEEAEACFQQALTTAQAQQAKSWELRASVSLARLWHQQGKTAEARQLLEEIYSWFTEGFATPDLHDAEAVLKALGSQLERSSVPAETAAEPTEAATAKTKQPAVPELPAVPPAAPAPHVPAVQPSAISRQPSSPNPHSPLPNPQSPSIFQREGDYWTISFAGTVCRIKDSRGLHYLSYLLFHPNEEVHVLTLSSGGVTADSAAGAGRRASSPPAQPDLGTGDVSDAGELLDPQARQAYTQRIHDLHAELEEAHDFNDLGRVERLQEEVDFLSQELSQAVGLGGRARRAGSAAERARTNVSKRVRGAIKRVAAQHPVLGEHLRQTIKTGAYCSYAPDPLLPIRWRSE